MPSIEPQPTPPPPTSPFQFSLRTLLLLSLVLVSSLAVFGAWGTLVFGLVVALGIYLRQTEIHWPALMYLALVFLFSTCLVGLLLPACGFPRISQ